MAALTLLGSQPTTTLGAPSKLRLGGKRYAQPWSSYEHYLTGAEGGVEIESEWMAARREALGIQSEMKTGRRQCSPP